MSLKVLVGRMDARKSIWEVDNENMEERIKARRERIRKRIGRRITLDFSRPLGPPGVTAVTVRACVATR